MKFLALIISALLLGACGSSNNGSSSATIQYDLGTKPWVLQKLVYGDVDVAIEGTSQITYNQSTMTFTIEEQDFRIPVADYGPCVYTAIGKIDAVTATTITTTIESEEGNCILEGDSTIERSYTLEGNTLTTTIDDGASAISAVYERAP